MLTYAVPFGLLGLAVLGAAGHLALGLALLAFTILDRVLLCLLVAGYVVRDRAALRKAWLYPCLLYTSPSLLRKLFCEAHA